MLLPFPCEAFVEGHQGNQAGAGKWILEGREQSYAWLEMADALSIYAAINLTLCKFQDGCGWCELATNPISLILLTSLVMFSVSPAGPERR